jgi:predicted PurR-regulated permease PerM
MRSIPGGSAQAARAQSARWGVFLAGCGGISYLCLSILRPFANVIAWSAVLAIIVYPMHDRLVRRTQRPGLSALITSALTVVAFLVPVLLVGGLALKQGVTAAHHLQNAFGAGWPRPSATPAWLARAGIDQAAVRAWIEPHVSDVVQKAGLSSVSMAASVLESLVTSVLVVFALFLLLRDGKRVVGMLADLLPFAPPATEALCRRIADVVQASVYGVVVIAILQGALCGAMFWLLGIPSAALWGMVTVFVSVLPVVGALAVWGPGVLFLALAHEWPQAVVLALWGTCIVSGIDNILRPRLVAGRVGLSELSMFFALLGGMSAFGALGIVLGPVVFATAAAIVETLRAPAVAERTPA